MCKLTFRPLGPAVYEGHCNGDRWTLVHDGLWWQVMRNGQLVGLKGFDLLNAARAAARQLACRQVSQ